MEKKITRVAACQMTARIGDCPHNLELAEKLVDEAFGKGAKWVVLPEFFPTGIAFHPNMEKAIMPLQGAAFELLQRAARKYHGYVGGSYIARWKNDTYNSFVLFRPDGSYGIHNKDIPTAWENYYYTGGSDDGIINTDDMAVGSVQCAEFVRWRTFKRLLGKVDCVVGGSACWTYPQYSILKVLFSKQEESSIRLMKESYARMARVLGVPLVHAALAGGFCAKMPVLGLPYPSYYIGESQIVDGKGNVLAQRDESQGAGVICADIEVGRSQPSGSIGKGYWTVPFPFATRVAMNVFGAHGRLMYRLNHQARHRRTK